MTVPPNRHPDDATVPSPDELLAAGVFDSIFLADFQATVPPVIEEPTEPARAVPVERHENQAADPIPPAEATGGRLRAVSDHVARLGDYAPLNVFAQRGTATETIPIAVFAVVAAMAVMPMFLTHLQHLSHMPHRAHYGLILVGFLVLVVRRWYGAVEKPTFRFSITDVALLAGAGFMFAVASRVGSPWITVLSCIFLAGLLLRRLPSVDNVGYVGPWAFLLLLLPLPLGFDQKLIQSLQTFVTGCSSRLIDLVGVNHLVSGNIIEVPGTQLFIDDACSGIQSLVAMLTCVAFFAAWTRRPSVLAIPLLAASVVMCIVVNILRIVVVVNAAIRGMNLTEGWPHECLGLVLFLLSLSLVYCSEGFFLFLLAPIINPATGTPDNRSARYWNSLTRSIHAAVYGVVDADRIDEPAQQVSWLTFRLPSAFTRFAMFGATFCFAMLGFSQHVGGAHKGPLNSMTQVESEMLHRAEALCEDSMPQQFGPWTRVRFERQEKVRGLISDSVSWVYRSPFYEATISLDYPFFGSHNVSECYQLAGWDVRERLTTPAGYSKARLHRPFGEAALLFYDVFDANGTIELESTTGRLSERFKQFENSSERPAWQLQLIIRSDYGLTKSDLQNIELAFIDVREHIRDLVTDQTPRTAGLHSDQTKFAGGTR